MARARYTTEQVIEAIRRANGIKSTAARMLGCDRRTIENYAKRHPTVAEALREAREQIIDLAEVELFKSVKNGDAWAVKWTLATIGKDRGYSERTEVSGPDGGPQEIVFRVKYGDDGDNGSATQASPETGGGQAE